MKVFQFIIKAGWLVPLGLSFWFLFSWLRLDVAPVVYGQATQMNSFPHLYAAEQFFWIAFVWLLLSCVMTRASK